MQVKSPRLSRSRIAAVPRRSESRSAGGHASPVVSGNRVIVHSRLANREVIAAYDQQTGKQLWQDGVEARGGLRVELHRARVWIFDMDDTLYPREQGVMRLVQERINTFMMAAVGLARPRTRSTSSTRASMVRIIPRMAEAGLVQTAQPQERG